MTAPIADVISSQISQQIGIINIDYPPVNALSQVVRAGLVRLISKLEDDEKVKVIILKCQHKTFIAGADIKEFGKAPTEPFLPDVVNHIEACKKPIIAALFGTTLGGGFEVALACHYRIALATAKVGLPEVNLGLIPGAGGTQRLMRILGPEKALQMITSGKPVLASKLYSQNNNSLIDAIVDSQLTTDLDSYCHKFAQNLIEKQDLNPRRIGELSVNNENFDWHQAKQQVIKNARGKEAPLVAFNVLEKTQNMAIFEGMNIEREHFLKLRASEQSSALIYAFGAEKKAAKTCMNTTAKKISKVGIIGGGNMGSGIATSFLMANFTLHLIEQTESALAAGVEKITANFAKNVKRGAISQDVMDSCLANLTASIDYQDLVQCQLVLEAVFEDIEVKKSLFKKLADICPPDTIFATNTSYLDINEIAQSLKNPEQLLGMHFFSPAHIMKLLEVVKAKHTSEQVIATAMQIAKKLNKVAVEVGVCFGFAGNRMYTRYGREIQQMLLEGAKVSQIDNALTQWGMAMGPLAVQDLSGIDIGHNARSAQPFPEHDVGYFRAAATMVSAGRLGQKTQAGFYCYDLNGQKQADLEVENLLIATAQQLSIKPQTFTDEEIVQRALFALISEGLALLNEGIVKQISDIDVIWLHGYGFPRYKGGPMFQAKVLGKEKVGQQLALFAKQFGKQIWPEVALNLLD